MLSCGWRYIWVLQTWLRPLVSEWGKNLTVRTRPGLRTPGVRSREGTSKTKGSGVKEQFLVSQKKTKCYDMGLNVILQVCISHTEKEERKKQNDTVVEKLGGGPVLKQVFIGKLQIIEANSPSTWHPDVSKGRHFIQSAIGPEGSEKRPGGSMEACREMNRLLSAWGLPTRTLSFSW